MKKTIINNTILFICIMAYILLFKSLFGDSNILIAVMSITGLLMFMARDLTGEPIKNTIGLVCFYLIIGIGAFFSAGNLILAIPINLIIVFIISYKFCHILKDPMYIPFTLLYLFLLAYPVPVHQLPLRLIALVVGALSIMAPQMLINKNKINKASSKIFSGLLELLDLKITCIENGQDIQELNLKINSSIKTLKAIIYDKKEQHFYLSKEGQKNLNILVALEKLSFLINSYNPNTNTTSISDIKELIYLLKKQIVKYDEKTFNTYIENLHTSNQNTSDLFTVKFLGSIMFIKDSLSNLHKENSTASSIYRNLKKDVLGLNNIKFNSIKLSYSIRISIEVTIACFIMQYFDLHQGRWIMYTVLSLTTPFFEYTKSKAKDRVIATLIGAIFVAISFSIFKDSLIRGLIIIGAGYGNIYCKTYRQKIVAVTISAIGAAVLVDNHIIGNLGNGTPLVLSIERVLLILTGAVIALIINKFFFHYDVAKANNKLNNISTEILKDLISNLTKIFKEHNITDYVSNSYLLTSQLENTIVENKKNYVDASPDVIYDNHNNLKLIVVSSIYELDKFSSKCTLDDNDTTQILKVIDNIKNNKPETYNLEDFNSLNGKILLSYLLDINEILPIA